jgi:hypothetical protein
MMHPNEMLSLINTHIVDIPPRLKLLIAIQAFRCTRGKVPMRRNQCSCTPSPSSSPLLLPPLQEFAEQSFAIGFILGRTASNAIHESLEIATHIVLG